MVTLLSVLLYFLIAILSLCLVIAFIVGTGTVEVVPHK